MANLSDLIEFIESSSSEHNSRSNWKNELSRSVPDWRNMVADSQNWDAIESVTSLSNHWLLMTFLDAGGLELGKRWFHSEASERRDDAREWLINYAPIDASLWNALDRSMKNHLRSYSES